MRKYLSVLLTIGILLAAAVANASPLAPASPRSALVTVVGTNGTPVQGAAIHFMEPGSPAFAVYRTDAGGKVAIPLSQAFSYWLRVWADGYATAETPYVPASDGLQLTVRLTPYEATLVGVVNDSQGRPVSGAAVSAWLPDLGLQAKTTTDESGLYELPKLMARAGYTLVVEARQFQPNVQTDLVLTPGARNQVDAAMTAAHGNVTGEAVNSRTETPAFGVTVELLLSGWGTVDRTSVDPYGYFALAAPPTEAGTYQLRFSSPSFETFTTAAFAVGPDSWTDFSGADRITLNPLFSEVSGTVLLENGSPLVKTIVELQRSGLGTVETAETDESGYVLFSKVPAGTYRIRALASSADHAASPWIALTGGDHVTADVSATFTDSQSFGASAIVGTVRDHQGNPVSGATVKAARGTQVVTAVTDSQGRYRLSVDANVEDEFDEPETSSGYHVFVAKDGFVPTDLFDTDSGTPQALFDVRARAANRADFTLYPATGTIGGRVLDDRGKPVAGISIVLVQEGAGEVARTTTSGAGHYRFAGLPVTKQARYLPVIKSDNHVEASINADGQPLAPISLQPGAAVTQTMTLRPAKGTIHGLVQAGADQPASGADVTVVRAADGATWTGKTKTNGSYSLAVPATPGAQYLVKVGRAGETPVLYNAALSFANNQAVVANLASAPAAGLTGKVYGADGTPLSRAMVFLWAEGAGKPAFNTVTDSEGTYRFANLPPGERYSVVVQSELNLWSALAPGETILTPLIAPAPGETMWADLLAPLP